LSFTSDDGKEIARAFGVSKTSVPSSPRVPPEGADCDEIQIDQLRPHNQQLATMNIQSEKQQQVNGNNHSSMNVADDPELNNQLSPSADSAIQMDFQRNSQLGHYSSIPFGSNTYAAFKKGNVVRGILCPSLTNSFR